MVASEKKSFQNLSTVSRNNKSNIHYFQITSLSFKTRTKCDKTTCDISIVFVGNVRFYSQFMTDNFDLKLSNGFKAIAIQTVQMGFYTD